MKVRGDSSTLDLLADLKPGEVAVRFDRDELRAATTRGRICRAVKLALQGCGVERETVAGRMTDYLGERVSKPILDRYASEGSEDHSISVERFMALIDATGDMRLISVVADAFGMAVVPRKYLAAIEDAQLADAAEQIESRRKVLKRSWRSRS